MEIIAQKTDFHSNHDFFTEIITQKYVSGMAMDVLFNADEKLLIYTYAIPASYSVQKMQQTPVQQLKETNILFLDDALKQIRINRKELPIYLNILPTSINIIDDVSLKKFNTINAIYIQKLQEILKDFSDLNISLHSISRNLALLL